MTPEPRYRIVIALDRSEYHEIVLEHALDQAARHAAPDLHFVNVVEDKHGDLDEAKSWLAVEAFDGLDVFARGKPEWRARLHVRPGRPAEEIAMLAAELDADLIVIGRFGTHRTSTADRILELAPCAVLVVGLTGHAVEAHPQCEKCVEVRAETGGERWFCAEHSSDVRHGLTERLPLSSSSIQGGPMF